MLDLMIENMVHHVIVCLIIDKFMIACFALLDLDMSSMHLLYNA